MLKCRTVAKVLTVRTFASLGKSRFQDSGSLEYFGIIPNNLSEKSFSEITHLRGEVEVKSPNGDVDKKSTFSE